MRKIRQFTLYSLGILALLSAFGFYSPLFNQPKQGEYIIIGWNDLGMHCANQDFSKMAVLPPYNNLMAHVIKKGSATTWPEIVTDTFSVTYEIPGNTYSVGKTNFWDYEFQLFGVNLTNNIGLTGKGLSGDMDTTMDYFHAEGIPITPYVDTNLLTEDPYQLALIKLFDASGNLLASTQPVIPVSNEITCVSSGCHTNEMDILNEHDNVSGFSTSNLPILCASCHSSNALGTTGTPGADPLSQVIHEKHKSSTSNCYKCHPGANTQCHRGTMYSLGMTCTDCHGSMQDIAESIDNGREPWLEEPTCGATACHGSNYAEEPGKLFRQSRGHGGLFCSTCHGSPHAIYPSSNARDNVQNIALQGYAGILNKCSVCHGITPTYAGPHGLVVTEITETPGDSPSENHLHDLYPNPSRDITSIPFSVADKGKVYVEVVNLEGKIIQTLVNKALPVGNYEVDFDTRTVGAGIYFCRLRQGNFSDSKKLVVLD
ncbi:MAG: T9SS type A sorting domain-containing protein [Bacteroidales bacterium]|nr:T9SS type A sorting domain-containing protein [Bacteroidales bacterium]MCF8457470.1 T9SS type A sorting domain-containing protein [Bacteroidales bacterium]